MTYVLHPSVLSQSEEHQGVMWALVFFLLEHAEDTPPDAEAPAVLELVLTLLTSQNISSSLHQTLLQVYQFQFKRFYVYSQRIIIPLLYPPISLIESLGMDTVILVTNREPESTGFGATGYHQKRDRKSSGTNS